MTTRRDFIKTAVAATVGTSAFGQATQAKTDPATGPKQLPRGLTLLSIAKAGGAETLGVKLPSGILDVADAREALKINAPTTLEDLLASGNAGALEQLIAAGKDRREFLRDEVNIKFGRLFTKPGKIVCVGLNYKEHAEEAGEKLPTVPILFNKFNNTLSAHNCTIKLPPREVSYKFDYETELLVVMGKTARNVSEAEALDYVAGYAIGHDFSARDLQLETGGQWMVGKTLDDFAPIGPYFVSADLVDPNNLSIETFVNDETKPRQSSHTSKFIFNPQKVISYTSKMFALEPGDIIFTGTPSGVIIGMPKEKQVWLKAGDRIVSRIDKLGTLKFDLA
ncbi:fumarylacetoacetate hydrolase family protein [Bradyrhizobium erythrophlei]|jgi:2-keto-4-pentenoate hydratase/2-oxohepta-3-ene-1,7-dioic acid hydratase in catechol pathway|uniref:Tat (Twin-arginine translocation) pathway signal sequence n=1 Tax=Bradyrhizobium erythrophlei TaxID=1437360 RepID=A0A1M7TRM9_9BRAD|nr:fumarylacetoacetate hydrolase family protein [Bradyrhizobium erythrophlei]SHN73414.1 Tat (twin-arginine translocation) pathway signal sequence [Bradyrhizobium erythrophlei]